MRVRIHRGAHEIGGNCIELESRGKRIVLDVGHPISVPLGENLALPDVSGLAHSDDSLLAVIISHPHPDHYGLLSKAQTSVPIYIGEPAARILREAAFFSPFGIDLAPTGFLRHREPFRITPYLNDHSAFDAYSLLIEADGRRLFYTGDIRGHGRKATLFEELLRDPPKDVHVLLMEGTNIRANSDGTERGPTEQDVEQCCVETFKTTEGMVLAMFSPQNVDRLVTMYRACLRSGRDLVLDLYAASIARATGAASIPQAGWDRVRVYLPEAQKAKVVRERAFDLTNSVRPHRIFGDELLARAGEIVMLSRWSMLPELDRLGVLGGASAIWSMWPGYLRNESGVAASECLRRQDVPLVVHHASGHAHLPDLLRLVRALAPGRVVPIHSLGGGRFVEFFPEVARRTDGEWWMT